LLHQVAKSVLGIGFPYWHDPRFPETGANLPQVTVVAKNVGSATNLTAEGLGIAQGEFALCRLSYRGDNKSALVLVVA
jgi:hypothetical protein